MTAAAINKAQKPTTQHIKKKKSVRRKLFPDSKPSKKDDDFFERFERQIVEEFKKRWNFDLIKGEPLEGKYKWVKTSVKSYILKRR